MDKRDMEKLMDKYKAEMLEFSKRNNISGYPQINGEKNDKREQDMQNALENNETFERDRSDPLSDAEEKREVLAVQAVPAQTDVPAQRNAPVAADAVTDGAQVLRRLCAGVNDASTPEQRARCKEINEFLAANPDSGTLKVETYASDRAFGVGSARVMVFLELPSGNVAVFDGLTDIDGISDTVRLPAPPRENSLKFDSPDKVAVYKLRARLGGYESVERAVEIFGGIKTIQPLAMQLKRGGEV